MVTLTPPPTPTTQTVVVDLPPEIIRHLAPADDELSQDILAIITAAIALAAAWIAYRGVIRQIRASGQEARRDREAEAQRLNRIEQNQLLTQAVRHMEVLAYIYMNSVGDDGEQDFETSYQEASITGELLRVVGLTKSANALRTFAGGVKDAYDNSRTAQDDPTTVKDVVDVFCVELSELESKSGDSAGRQPNRIRRLLDAWPKPSP